MKNYSFVKTKEELAGAKNVSSTWRLKHEIDMNWLMDEEAYRRLLPPGLEPLVPQCFAFIAHFPDAAAGLARYSEAGLFVLCAHDGVPGVYNLSMQVDASNGMGVYLGREIFGFPKKLSHIRFERRGDEFYGSVERNGVTFFEMTANIDESAQSDIVLNESKCDYTYLLDYKLKSEGMDIPHMQNLTFYDISLHQMGLRQIHYSSQVCTVETKFAPSEDDPWIECKPVKMLSCSYNILDSEIYGTRVVRKYTDAEFEQIQPYLYGRWDTNVLGKQHEVF